MGTREHAQFGLVRDFFTLVPKLQLGNPGGEASALRDGKLELPALNSQAEAWELAQTLWTGQHASSGLGKEFERGGL
ncbi:hypothetical protein [Candidatus Methylobacter oryzae]|uniref:hypothetical protein n=1 Tax=Candidatus Methylobacter oryzae TaxID=2497749 RepID=UPI0012B57CE8|nr:hypothetical protein [Candidatus Methylobacter oryzae]